MPRSVSTSPPPPPPPPPPRPTRPTRGEHTPLRHPRYTATRGLCVPPGPIGLVGWRVDGRASERDMGVREQRGAGPLVGLAQMCRCQLV